MKKIIPVIALLVALGALAYYLSLSRVPLPVSTTSQLPESVDTVTIDSFEDCPDPITAPCDPTDEMCQKELRILKSYCSWIQRPQEDKLVVSLRNGQQKVYLNKASEEPEELEEYVTYQAESYQQVTDYLVIFAAQVEFYHRLVLNLNTGKETSVAGEVSWSPDGRFFVSTNEDWEAGYTPNEVKVFFCGNAGEACRQVYSRDDVGGRSAEWEGPNKVKIIATGEEIKDQETLEHKTVTLVCECSEESCNCR